MSLKTFLAKVWATIKGLFDDLPEDFKTAIHIGVEVTEAIKTFDDTHPEVADAITAIIPGDLDDKVKEAIRAKLPILLTELKLVDTTAGLTDPAEITAAAIKVLQGLDGDIKSSFLHSLSILIAQVAADGELTWSDGVYVLQWYYDHQFTAAA